MPYHLAMSPFIPATSEPSYFNTCVSNGQDIFLFPFPLYIPIPCAIVYVSLFRCPYGPNREVRSIPPRSRRCRVERFQKVIGEIREGRKRSETRARRTAGNKYRRATELWPLVQNVSAYPADPRFGIQLPSSVKKGEFFLCRQKTKQT